MGIRHYLNVCHLQMPGLTFCQQRIITSIQVKRLSTLSTDPDYDSMLRDVDTNVPLNFNFARDIIDKHAEDPTLKNKLAFYYVSEKDENVTKWSFKDLSDKSKFYANSLRSFGSIDRAILILPKIPEWWILNIAALRNNTALMPGTILLTSADIDKRIRMSKADCVITDFQTAIKVDEGIGATLKKKILVEKGNTTNQEIAQMTSKGWTTLSSILRKGNENQINMETENYSTSSPIVQIFFTSGTTGEPKMVVHDNTYPFAVGIIGKYWYNLKKDDLHWNLSDNGWAKMAWSGVFGPWSQAAGVFIHEMNKFEPPKIIETLTKHPITSICAAPTLYRSLVVAKDINKLHPSGDNRNSLQLRQCLSAGEPLNEEVIKKWNGITNIVIREGYGQTETTLLAGTFKGMNVKPGSMGKPGPGVKVGIIDDEGNKQDVGVHGNIAVDCTEGKPLGLFKEYLDDPVRTKATILGNYYITGDKGYKDKDGYIWFDSRGDDVINSSGYRIGPFEVESALISHPAVLESAAVASPDEKRGMVVKAFVVLSESGKKELKKKEVGLSLQKVLQEHCKNVTAPYKYPRIIEFVDTLPKTVSGKIQRVKLRQLEQERYVEGK